MWRRRLAWLGILLLAGALQPAGLSYAEYDDQDAPELCDAVSDVDFVIAQVPPGGEPDVGTEESLPEPEGPDPAVPAPAVVPGAPVTAVPVDALITALGSGNVLAGPAGHRSGCSPRRSTLHRESSPQRMTITVQNLGDCRVTIFAAGRRMVLPGLRSGYTSGSLTVEADRFDYACGPGRECRFLWVVRGH